MFVRLHTDGTAQRIDLAGLFAGPTRTPCWLIGGGPSLAALPIDAIAASPAPKFAINLAGHGLLRPTFWTSYDPTARFQRSIYLDPSILKFVHRCRAMDLVPETTFKVCEAPATFFFDRDPQRGFHNFLVPQPSSPRMDGQATPAGDAVTDWQDSFIQAIEIAYRLGFRVLYLAGCDMFVPPSPEQLALAESVGVCYRPREPLRDFFDRCRQSGLPLERFESLPSGRQYHFDETKPLAATIQTDLHYFRVAQYLRLSRRALALAGMELVSVTPVSRLNDHFPYRPASDLLTQLAQELGDPRSEPTRGRYTGTPAVRAADLGPMRDFPPHNWPPRPKPAASPPPAAAVAADRRERIRHALADPRDAAIPVPMPPCPHP